jgi:hypothetical protein
MEIVGASYALTLAPVAEYEDIETIKAGAEHFVAYDALVATEGCTLTLEANQFMVSTSWTMHTILSTDLQPRIV